MFVSVTNRIDTPERLDTGDYTPAEYARWLGEMRVVHNFFGELRALKKTLLKEIETSAKTNLSILDVGAGNGYVLGVLAKQMCRRDALLVGVEINAQAAASLPSFGALAVQGDGTRLPFADGQFDHAYCTLMLHHLTDEDAVKLIAEMARVSRRRIFIVDLNRDRTAYYMYKLVAPVFFQRLTVDDGALSILRSRTRSELRALGEAAQLTQIEVVRSRLNRLVLSGIGEKQ